MINRKSVNMKTHNKKQILYHYIWDRSIQRDIDLFSQQFDNRFSDKLTTSLMYYSYHDFVQLVYALIHKIKTDLYCSSFLENEHLTDSLFETIWEEHLRKTCFVAVSDEAGASSHVILSILKNRVYCIW